VTDDKQTDKQADRRTTTAQKARLLLTYGRLKIKNEKIPVASQSLYSQ